MIWHCSFTQSLNSVLWYRHTFYLWSYKLRHGTKINNWIYLNVSRIVRRGQNRVDSEKYISIDTRCLFRIGTLIFEKILFCEYTRSYPVKQDLLGEIMFHWRDWLTHQQSPIQWNSVSPERFSCFFNWKTPDFSMLGTYLHNNFLLIKIGPRRVITFPKDWLIKVILGSCPFWSLRLGRKEHIVGFINHLFFSWKWRKF